MNTVNPQNLSPFGQVALALDAEFTQFNELSGQIDRLDIDSESGLERGKKLLAAFSECGERVGTGIQELAKQLDVARTQAESAAEIVTARASAIQKRHEESERLLVKFQTLADMVRKVTTAVAQLQKPAGGKLSDEDRAHLVQFLPEINTQLGVLFDEASKLQEEASAAKNKTVERNADYLRQSLQAIRGRLSLVADLPGKNAEQDVLNSRAAPPDLIH